HGLPFFQKWQAKAFFTGLFPVKNLRSDSEVAYSPACWNGMEAGNAQNSLAEHIRKIFSFFTQSTLSFE
ncbi:MAG: hypothetical protein JXR70_08220, partial [Spirochaetales bacterium]|nr:hypothetical protein [Spirochaetales bacterium]